VKNQSKNFYRSTSLVCPLDVVKSRLQAQTPKSSLKFTGTFNAFYQIIRKEGFLTLWRGLIPTLGMTVPATTLYFTTYEKLQSHFFPYFQSFSPLISGSMARLLTATVWSPLEMYRTYLQSNSKEAGSMSKLKCCHMATKE